MSEQIFSAKTAAAPNRVVVIGSRGFVGSHLCEALTSRRLPVAPISSKEIDLINPDSAALLADRIRSDDHIVLVSALTPDKGRDAATLMKNLQMIQNFADVLVKKPCRHLTYIGSDAVYTEQVSLIDERTPCDPPSFHGVMHITREKILLEAVQRAKVPLCRIRPCALFGPGDTHNSYGPNRFVRTALADSKVVLGGGGEEKRDHLFIGDFAAIVCACVEHSAEGVVNAATGSAVSFREVADLVAGIAENGTTVQPSDRQSPVTHRHFDIANLLRIFPMTRFTPLREALSETIRAGRSS